MDSASNFRWILVLNSIAVTIDDIVDSAVDDDSSGIEPTDASAFVDVANWDVEEYSVETAESLSVYVLDAVRDSLKDSLDC